MCHRGFWTFYTSQTYSNPVSLAGQALVNSLEMEKVRFSKWDAATQGFTATTWASQDTDLEVLTLNPTEEG